MVKRAVDVFIYCPRCKNELTKKEGKLLECGNCGFYFYLNAAPTVGALLINNNDEFLFVERKGDPKKGYWDVPGGYLELNETFEEGLTRELREELGISISDFTYIGSAADIYPFKGVIYNTIVALYSGKVGEEVYPSDDVASFKFFSRNDLPVKHFAFPGLFKLIEKYLKNNK